MTGSGPTSPIGGPTCFNGTLFGVPFAGAKFLSAPGGLGEGADGPFGFGSQPPIRTNATQNVRRTCLAVIDRILSLVDAFATV
ncbi:hypothetical protein [Singulisphaera acidiphila]|uniref:hypothetical protein n=1 Tax=Singulisphaera acidiphila TaxID=466153 RepID=UPI0002E673A9|nr:hypothetical protein [Singulisphaera acidiphila]